MEADIIITIAMVTGAVLIVNQIMRLLRNRAMHRTIRDAIGRDSAALPELVARIDESPSSPNGNDERAGLVLIALALALAIYAAIAASPGDVAEMGGLALFPGFVGAALLGRSIWVRRRGEVR